MTEYPAIELKTHDIWHDEQVYVAGDESWLVKNLWKAASKLPVYEIPLIALRTDIGLWDNMSFMEFLNHAKLVNEADLDYPIILDADGAIADGRHRLGKAIIEGHTTIKAQRLEFMPEPDFVYDEEQEE